MRQQDRVIIKPLRITNNTVVVAELEKVQSSRFDEELKTLILRQEFEEWLRKECSRMLNKLRMPT